MTDDRPGPAATLRAVQDQLRARCDRYGVGVEQRGRLVLAATLLIRKHHPETPDVSSKVRVEPDGTAALEVRLRLAGPISSPVDLPLPTELDGTTAIWRIALPDAAHRTAGTADTDPEVATEQELRAALTRLDTVERAHRELKHELAETNSGVLAMFIEHEERDEQLRKAHAVIFQELEDALRPQPLVVPGLEFGVHYQPAEADDPTGGDLYDWFTLPDGSVHITVVDAVGHGVACTRAAVTVTHTLRTLALEGHPLDDLIRRTSRIATDQMATVLLARLDPGTGRLCLANGGHPPALRTPSSGQPTYLPVPGRGVGFPDPGSREVREEHLDPGDTLLLYTDGLIETRGSYCDGERRLVTVAHHHRAESPDAMVTAVVHDMHDVIQHRDDTLVLAIRYVGSTEARADPV